jgi:hypothetical protein
MKNTRLTGHGLLNEGAPFLLDITTNPPVLYRMDSNGTSGVGRGRCTCRAMSPEVETAAARRAWHVQHKAAVVEAALKLPTKGSPARASGRPADSGSASQSAVMT